MSRITESRRALNRRTRPVATFGRKRRPSITRRKLDPPAGLIAPRHSLCLPTIDGVQNRFRFFNGTDTVLPLARRLIRVGLLRKQHLETVSDPIKAVELAVAEIVQRAFGNGEDQFSVELGIADRLDDYRKPEKEMIFFIWNNTSDPQYIPLRPIYERLDGNPLRENLMASLYHWLYRTASRVFEPFGLAEAQNLYQWRREAYLSEREAAEDVDLEGEVEYADPAKVVEYIRESQKLKLKKAEISAAIATIAGAELRDAFIKAHQMYLDSRAIRLPEMSNECSQLVHDAAYYMDGSPIPAIGISHWRDDPIVAWFDEFCRDQFECGETPRAPIILCFHPRDTEFFLRIVKTLPRMVRTVAALSEWVRFAEELENASRYADRDEP